MGSHFPGPSLVRWRRVKGGNSTPGSPGTLGGGRWTPPQFKMRGGVEGRGGDGTAFSPIATIGIKREVADDPTKPPRGSCKGAAGVHAAAYRGQVALKTLTHWDK